jgi:1-deoxy-D-xylulose 5-phosphate reductoisomerase
VELFLMKKIGFLDIGRLVEKTLESHNGIGQPTLGDIIAADAWARDAARAGF